MNIVFLYNIKLIPPSLTDEQAQIYAEFDSPATINGIKKAIEANGHKVHMVEANEEAYIKLKELKAKKKVDLVFNIAEGFYGEAREAHLPAMLEMLRIPYTGSGPLNLAITLDKARTKEILSYYKIPNAKFQVFQSQKDKLRADLDFPLIVKPVREGSSKGIMDNCVVKNDRELRKKLNEVLGKYKQAAIVEEFLPGTEFTVGILEKDKGPAVLPIIEVKFDDLPKGMNKIDSYEAKWFYDDPEKGMDPLVCPAKIPKELEERIKRVAIATFRVLNCKDLARIDIRLDKKGVPKIIEINSLPGLIPDPRENSRFPRAARTAGISFNEMIGMIINSAKRRYKIDKT
jgi:D-alanine-D-alanine ligase